jgi:hypothetical protein
VRVSVEAVGPASARLTSRAAPPSDGFVGMTLDAPGRRGNPEAPRVVAFDRATGIATFDRSGRVASGVADLTADEEAPTLAARLLTGTPVGGRVPPISLRLATTRGHQRTARTQGSAHGVVRDRRLRRPARDRRPDAGPTCSPASCAKSPPLADAVIEIPGRLAVDGKEISPIDVSVLRAGARRRRAGISTRGGDAAPRMAPPRSRSARRDRPRRGGIRSGDGRCALRAASGPARARGDHGARRAFGPGPHRLLSTCRDEPSPTRRCSS